VKSEWVQRYLIKRAVNTALTAMMTRPLTQPAIVPEVRTYDDLRTAQEIFEGLDPMSKRVPLRRALARLGVNR